MKYSTLQLFSLLLVGLFCGCGSRQFGADLPESFDGLNRDEIEMRLPSDAYLLIDTTSRIPSTWPTNLRQVAEVETVEAGATLSQMWWMTLDGNEWIWFYAFGLDALRNNFGQEPAMIYEQRDRKDRQMVLPVMLLFFTESGIATNSSKKWCEVVRGNAIKRHEELRTR